MNDINVTGANPPMYRLRNTMFPLLTAALLATACEPASAPAQQAAATPPPTTPTPAPAPMPAPMPAPTPDAQAPQVALSPELCAKDDGWPFFERFVESADVRRAYSRIELAPRANGAGGKPDFDGFRIANVDNQWVLVDPSAPDVGHYPRVDIQTSLDDGVFKVDYTRARYSNGDETVEKYGETASYRFEFVDGCWALTGATPAP